MSGSNGSPDVEELPLPRAGFIREVIHLSDVHIPFFRHPHPCNAWKHVRHAEVIDRLVEAVWDGVPSVRDGTAIAVIAGDVFDCKHSANAATVNLFHRLVTGLVTGNTCGNGNGNGNGNGDSLTLMMPLYVTPGNHDIHLDEESGDPSTTSNSNNDLLGVLLAPLTRRLPVRYMATSGLYGVPGSGALFGLLHLRDVAQPGNCSGDVRPLEDVPLHVLDATDVDGFENDARLLLYHGQVAGYRCASSSGEYVDQKGIAPYIPEVAACLGYDACLLGDIHTMQLHGMTEVRDGTTDENDNDDGQPFAPRRYLRIGTFSWGSSTTAAPEQREEVTDAVKKKVKHKKRPQTPWAYSGSIAQLNAGERVFPHGFLTWNLPSRRVTAYHVVNPFGTLFCSENAQGVGKVVVHNAVTPLCESGGAAAAEPVIMPSVPCWMPRQVALRVISNGGGGGVVSKDRLERLRALLAENCGISVLGENRSSGGATTIVSSNEKAHEAQSQADAATNTTMPKSSEASSDVVNATASASSSVPLSFTIDLSSFGRPECWIDFVRERARNEQQWETWLRRPEHLTLPSPPNDDKMNCLPDSIVAKLRDRNAKLTKKCAERDEVLSAGGAVVTSYPRSRSNKFSLRTLRWSWLLCYGPDNWFDFRDLDGKVALLSAPNGCGKSAVLEILCLALYGQSMPSRGGKGALADCLFSGSTTGSCSVDVSVDERDSDGKSTVVYRLSRSFSVSASTGKLTSTARVSKVVPPQDSLVTVKDGSAAVNAWTSVNLGRLETFLLRSLCTQSGDADFFGMKPAEQMALLDEALALDATRLTCELLKEARLAHAAITDAVSTATDTCRSSAVAAVSAVDAAVTAWTAWTACTVEDVGSAELSRAMNDAVREIDEYSRRLQASRDDARTEHSEERRCYDTLITRIQTTSTAAADHPTLDHGVDDDNDEEQHQRLLEPPPDITGRELARMRADLEKQRSTLCASVSASSSTHEDEDKDEDYAERARVAATEEARLLERRDECYLRRCLDVQQAVCRVREEYQRLHVSGENNDGNDGGNLDDDDADDLDARADGLRKRLRSFENTEKQAAAAGGAAAVAADATDEKIGETETRLGRMYEDTKRQLADAKEARRRADEQRQVLHNLGYGDDENDANYDLPPEAPRDAHYRENMERWSAERASLINQANTGFGVYGDDDDALLKKVRDKATALRDVVAWMNVERFSHDNHHQDPFNPDCAACVGRRTNLRRRAETALQKTGITPCNDNEDGECVASLQEETALKMDRWARAWQAGAMSRSCGADAVKAAFERDAALDRARCAWEARALFRRLSADAERLTASSKTAKQAYQDACVEAEAASTARSEARRRTDQLLETEREAERLEARARLCRARAALTTAEQNAVAVETELREVDAALARVRDERQDATERAFRASERHEKTTTAASVTADQVRELAEREARLNDKQRAWDAWEKSARRDAARRARQIRELEMRATDLEREASAAVLAAHKAQAAAAAFFEERRKYVSWKGYRDALDARKRSLDELGDVMSGFTSWVYSCRAIPALVREVNSVLGAMGLDLSLSGSCRAEDSGALAWKLNGSPVHKSSGMQRFAASLAMRIALAQLGATSAPTCDQLIIDEGFVTLDAHNIAHVPEFLHHGILSTCRYASVLLVSHLEGVQEAADVVVPITLSSSPDTHRQHSVLRFGVCC